MVKKYNAKIIKIKNLTNSVKEFELDLGEEFKFKAGQFVNLSFDENNETLKRAYSIASSPNNNSTIKLCIKLVENGKVTPKLFKKKVGDKLNIQGPLGLFTLDKANQDKLVFIGTGTGIAPLKSMIFDEISKQKEILDSENEQAVSINKEIILIFGVRFEEDILYKNEFKEIEKNNSNFKFIPVISKPSKKWLGRTGHVQDNFDIIDINNSNIFICGLPIMFEEAKEKLIKLGMDEKKIFHEVFR